MEEVSAVRVQQKDILTLIDEVNMLHLQNAEKEKRIALLKNRVVDLEHCARMNNVNITAFAYVLGLIGRPVSAKEGEPG